MTPARFLSRQSRRFSPFASRLLSELSIGGLWIWFALKFFLSSDSRLVEVASGVLVISAVLAGLALMFSTYAHQAHDTGGTLDERELAQRNKAHFWTVLYVLAATAGGYAGIEVASARLVNVSPTVMQNFLVVLFLTTLWFPAALLAWEDVPDRDEA